LREKQVIRRVRLAEIDQLLLFGRVEITSAGIAALARRRHTDIVFLSAQGYFRARLAGRSSRHVTLRLQQLHRASDPGFCIRISRSLVAAKIAHQRQLLLRAQRRLRDEEVADVLGRLRLLTEQASQEENLDRLRGLEGMAAALYFGVFGKLIRSPELSFSGRSRRPPRDPVNACLSFGYTMLGSTAETEVLRCGLEPQIGYFHQPHDGRPSLMLDLIEPFRPFMDALVLRLINRRQLGPLDFERRTGEALSEILAEAPVEDAGNDDVPPPADGSTPDADEGVYLAATGRRVFLTEFFQRLRDRLYYPPRRAALELRDILREETYQLARVVEGEEAEFRPFVRG